MVFCCAERSSALAVDSVPKFNLVERYDCAEPSGASTAPTVWCLLRKNLMTLMSQLSGQQCRIQHNQPIVDWLVAEIAYSALNISLTVKPNPNH